MTTTVRRWPLLLIALPAAVAVWSGWVGLGGMCGFGIVHPLPGIASGFRLNTAITLPVGVEAYGAFALGAWLAPGTVPQRARTFAKRSAIGSLALGMTGQVVFHLLAAAHAHRAPWPVTMLVACMPVCTLGFGVALAHLLRSDEGHGDSGETAGAVTASEPADLSRGRHAALSASDAGTVVRTGPQTGGAEASQTGTAAVSVPVGAAPPGPVPDSDARAVRKQAANRSGKRKANRSAHRATGEDAEREFAAEIAAGEIPSLYQIRTRLHVGNDRAKLLRQHIARQALTT